MYEFLVVSFILMNKKILPFLTIIIAGETIFMLPFLVPRLLRPLMLESWQMDNTTIGLAFSAYGFSSIISYFFGGPLADKYSPRILISLSLLITAIGGLALLNSPSAFVFVATYFFFGISTILLMWGALIKVTHIIGGDSLRASAMGFLDSGRGFVAALVSTLLVSILGNITHFSTQNQLQAVYLTTIAITGFVSILVWFSLKNFKANEKIRAHQWSLDKAKIVIKDKNVWLLGLIVLSSYCGYKNIDNYALYLVDVQKTSLEQSSFFTSIIFWLRPISALLAGLLADKIAIRVIGGRFLFLSLLLALGAITQFLLTLNFGPSFNLIFTTILFSSAFAYSLRAIYFAVFGELNIPENVVGTTVGIVSLVGFMPDFFFGIVTGYLIDNYPGKQGFEYVFSLTALFLLIGGIAALFNYFSISSKSKKI